jgi:isocitrate dehydrogenase (NAD+)
MHRVTLIEGDGIGPEVVVAARRVLEAAGADIQWEPVAVGVTAKESFGEALPTVALESLKRNQVGLKGPVTTPVGSGIPSVNVGLRKELGLYACVRPIRSLPGVPCLYPDIDLTIIRENTEDLYTGIEHEIAPGVVEGLKVITEKASLRIVRFAFQYAQQAGYSKVTAAHKANIMKLTDGLFLNCCRQAAQEFPRITFDDKIVDNLSMRLVMHPQEFGLLVAPNLYGDILSDLAAGLVGGLGLVPGANIGEGCAVFEAVHGSWPEAAGNGIANPTAMILTAAMLLQHLGEEATAQAVEEAVKAALREGSCLTRDLGGSATTDEFTEAVINHLHTYSRPRSKSVG